jgi:hypothetical protein
MTLPLARPGWYEPEQRIVSRYIDAVAKGRYETMLDAANACMAEIAKLHGRWRRDHPREARAIKPRTFQSIYTILRKESRVLGRSPSVVDYSPAEIALLERSARAVGEGRYKTVADSTRAAWPEFERIWAKAPKEARASLPRSYSGVFQRVCQLAQKYDHPRPESVWFPAEDRVVDRVARRVLAGDYPSAASAVADCRAELSRVHEKLRGPGLPRLADSCVRTPDAVHIRLVQFLRRLGRCGPKRVPWTVPEQRVVAKWARRHDKTVSAGTPWMLSDTIAMLQAELGQRGMRARPDASCRQALVKLVRVRTAPASRTCGRAPRGAAAGEKALAALARFRLAQQPILEKHAQALVRDPRHDISEAARRCRAELERLSERAAQSHAGVQFRLRWQTFKTVHTMLRRRARKLGMPKLVEPFGPDVDRVVRSYAREYLEGKYPRISVAGAACLAELARLRKRDPVKYAASARRNKVNVCARIDRMVLAYGLPHAASPFLAAELRIVDRYARGVADGRHKSPLPAARPCYRDLTRLWRRLARRIEPPLRRFAGRTFDAAYQRVRLRAREFGYRGATRRRWLPAERRIAAKWLKRYLAFRDSETPWTIADTAGSLQEDLATSGFQRTLDACHDELLLEFWGRIPESKFEG